LGLILVFSSRATSRAGFQVVLFWFRRIAARSRMLLRLFT
jgi:hypothetical protein